MTSVVKRAAVHLLLSTCCLNGAAATEVTTGRSEGLGGTLLLSRSSATDLLVAPTGGIKPGEGRAELTYRRRFGLSQMDHVSAAVAYRYHALSSAVGFDQFGRCDLYCERAGRLMLSLHIDSLSLGLSLSTMRMSFGGPYDDLGATSGGIGFSWRSRPLAVAVTIRNLVATAPVSGRRRPNRILSVYMECQTNRSCTVTGRITAERTERPQFGLGQKLQLSSGAFFFWGIATAPLTYGGGLEVLGRGLGISYAASYHPSLGFSHTASMSVGFGSSGEVREKE